MPAPLIHRPARRPRLEALEVRAAPAVIQWDGGPTGNGTDWFDPANWADPNGRDALPGPNDDVQLTVNVTDDSYTR